MGAPAAAFQAFEPDALVASSAHEFWQEGDSPLPALFISHGAPPLFEDSEWIDQLFDWSNSMAKPTGIVVVSAHWESAPITISAPNPHTGLTYDFGGFAPAYYNMQWATPDASVLGQQVKALLSGIDGLGEVHENHSRGLDHGAWVPLKVMYPLADIPVVQISIPNHNPMQLVTIGERLGELRQQGVLVIGSGFMTHGLPFLTQEMMMGHYPAWSSEFDAWAWEALQNNDLDALADYKNQAPGMPYAHPTVEHFLPMFITMGAGTEPASVTTVIEGNFWGLAKRSFQLN